MTLTLPGVIDSIAGVLQGNYPDYPVYSSPNQQGTDLPCFFVFFMPTEIKNRVGPRFIRDIGIDIVFLTERNTQGAYDLMADIADTLDYMLEFVHYVSGDERQDIRSFDREWKIDDGELHYQFHLKAMVSYPDDTPSIEFMQDYEGGATGGENNR